MFIYTYIYIYIYLYIYGVRFGLWAWPHGPCSALAPRAMLCLALLCPALCTHQYINIPLAKLSFKGSYSVTKGGTMCAAPIGSPRSAPGSPRFQILLKSPPTYLFLSYLQTAVRFNFISVLHFI